MPASNLDEYARLSAPARSKLSKAELSVIINNEMNANTLAKQNIVNINEIKEAIGDIITKTLEQTIETKIREIVDDIKGVINADIEPMKTEIQSLRDDLNDSKDQFAMLKKVSLEQQKQLEFLKREKIRNNVFISGLPNTVKIGNNDTVDNKTIVGHVLKFVLPTINDTDYKIDKAFEPKVGFTRHSAILSFKSNDKKIELLEKCKGLKERTDVNDWKRKVFIKSEQTPLTNKENSRLYEVFKELRTRHEGDEANVIKLMKGKLYQNEVVVDEFNLENQIF